MKLNDWKIIQIRNDIKAIRKILDKNALLDTTLIFDIILVVFGVFLDQLVTEEKKFLLWGMLTLCSVFIPLLLYICCFMKIKSKEKLESKLKNTKKLVDVFDDEITYLIMSAEVFNNTLNLKFGDLIDKQEALLFKFYYIETAYYLDKTVRLLWTFENNLSAVINAENLGITKSRLKNAIALVASLCNSTVICVTNKKEQLEGHKVSIDCSEIKKAYEALTVFVNCRKDIFDEEFKSDFLKKL